GATRGTPCTRSGAAGSRWSWAATPWPPRRGGDLRRDGPPRSRPAPATVVALEETEVVEIDETQFFIMIRENPHFALQLMRLLSERLRQAEARARSKESGG